MKRLDKNAAFCLALLVLLTACQPTATLVPTATNLPPTAVPTAAAAAAPIKTAAPMATIAAPTAALTNTVPPTVEVPVETGGPKIAVDQYLHFAAGTTALEQQGAVISGERDRYTLDLKPGETLDVQISALEDNAVFTILGPDRAPLTGTEEGQDIVQWSAPIIEGGTYAILIGPTRGNATYTLKVQVRGGQ